MRKALLLFATLALSFQPTAEAAILFNGNVTVTSYNSLAGQTDSSPNITATGTRTRPRVVAVSRDLVRAYGYHAKLRFTKWRKMNGCNPNAIPSYLLNSVFLIEDTMNARYTRKVDIWLPSRSQSINFGKCIANVQIYR